MLTSTGNPDPFFSFNKAVDEFKVKGTVKDAANNQKCAPPITEVKIALLDFQDTSTYQFYFKLQSMTVSL